MMPLRRVFSARPALPRPYGPVRPPEPSSTAQLQATLKDKCTGSKLAQALEASDPCRSLSAEIFRGYLRAIRLFLTFVNQSVGDLMCLTLAHLSDFIAGCHVSQAEDRTALKCSAIMMSKALSWFARIGQKTGLSDLLGSLNQVLRLQPHTTRST